MTAIERAASKLDALAKLGADAVGDEIVEPEASAAQRFDVILDVVGALPPTRARELLAPGGVATYIGGSPRRILQVVRSSAKHGDSGGRVRLLAAVPNRDLPALAALAASGALRAIVDGPHPLEEAPHQVERLRSGEVFGKVVIVP